MSDRRESLCGIGRRGPLAAGVGAAALTGLLLAGGGRDCPAPDIAPFLLEGDLAPGTGAAFQAFDRPNISESGDVAFAGDTDGDTSFDDVVYLNTTLVAQEGDPAPSVPGGTYSSFEFFETGHQVNTSGAVAYIATLRDVPAEANRAVYVNDTLIAREGDEPLMIPGRLYVDFGFAAVADDGSVGYLADVDGSTTDDSVIFVGDIVLYRQGDPITILPGETWDGDFDEVQWNGGGDVLFEGNTSMPLAEDQVIFRRLTPGPALIEEIVAREGQPLLAHTGPDFFEGVLQTALAENGRWALRGTLQLAPSDADAIILTEVGFMAQEGDPVPEMPGVVLGNFNGVDVNSNGDVLYLANLEGATPFGVDEGLFINGCLMITDGVQAPGLPAGTMLTDIGFEDMYINDAGEVVFAAGYDGGDGLFTFTFFQPEPCPPDVNEDGVVDVLDLLAVLAAWGAAGGPEDINDDGIVDVLDLLEVLAGWGPCPP